MAEVFEDSRLSERALGPEIGDFQRLFLSETCGHELAEQPHHFLVPERPLVALQDFAQHLRFALRTVKLRGAAQAFYDTDLLSAASAL
jgi:hypothetical protein